MTLNDLPKLIQDRFELDECVDVNIALVDAFHLTVEQQQALLALETDILLKNEPPENLLELLKQKLFLDEKSAERLAVELWGNYFLLFQDFLGSVDELIARHGGNIAGFQERAKELLSPSRQLAPFLHEYLADTPLEDVSDDTRGELIEAVLDRVTEKMTAQGFADRMHAILLKGGLSIDAGDHFVDTIEGRIAGGTLTNEWALYYRNLADTVLAGRQIVFDELEKSFTKSEPTHEEQKKLTLLGLIQHFDGLPETIRTHFSSPSAENFRKEIEYAHNIQLEELILRAAIKDFPIEDLAIVIKKEFGLNPENASAIRDEIIQKLFLPVGHYYGLGSLPEAKDSSATRSQITEPSNKRDTEFHPVIRRDFELQDPSEHSKNNSLPPALPSIPQILPAQPKRLPTQEEYGQIIDVVCATQNKDTGFDELALRRAKQILITRLRNIRTIVETKEKLMSSLAVGGAGLSNDLAEHLLRATNSASDAISRGRWMEMLAGENTSFQPSAVSLQPSATPESQNTNALEDGSSGVDANSQPSAVSNTLETRNLKLETQNTNENALETQNSNAGSVETRSEITSAKLTSQAVGPTPPKQDPALTIEEVDGLPVLVEKNLENSHQLSAVSSQPSNTLDANRQPSAVSSQPAVNLTAQAVNVPKAPRSEFPHPALAGAQPIAVRLQPVKTDNPKTPIADVKTPRLIDGIEELRMMTLKDFRRLSQDPMEAIKNIYQKILALEKDSFTKKMKGIEAWKENEISAFYREMSFGGQSGKEPALTEGEFDALVELNEMLRN